MAETTPGPARFKDPYRSVYPFRDRVAVACPRCAKRAEVHTDPATHRSTFHCPDCHHHLASDNTRMDLSLEVYCNACAHRISVHIPNVKTKRRVVRVKCPACGAAESYRPSYAQYRAFATGAAGTDPSLGLDLWYRAAFGEDLLWAYNYDHLHYLEGYIGAALRERNDPRYVTLGEKLPRFMQLAKNRAALLKLIARLKRK